MTRPLSAYYTTAVALVVLIASAIMAAAQPAVVALRGADKEQMPPETHDTWYAPKYLGRRVDWCFSYDKNTGAFDLCGSPAANAFCRFMGRDRNALYYAKEQGITEPTINLDKLESNNLTTHDAFLYITCTCCGNRHPSGPDGNVIVDNGQPVGAQTFHDPRVDDNGGPRVDFCLGYDDSKGQGTDDPAGFYGCGDLAANVFCNARGLTHVMGYEKQVNTTEPSMYIGQHRLNPNPTHDVFGYITCMK